MVVFAGQIVKNRRISLRSCSAVLYIFIGSREGRGKERIEEKERKEREDGKKET